MKAARQFEPLDSRLARETYLDALAAATFAGRLALSGGIREVAEAARAAPPPPGPARAPDLLLDGLALLICEGYPAGAPVLRQAVSVFRGTDISREEGLRWLWLACRSAQMVWDYDSYQCRFMLPSGANHICCPLCGNGRIHPHRVDWLGQLYENCPVLDAALQERHRRISYDDDGEMQIDSRPLDQ